MSGTAPRAAARAWWASAGSRPWKYALLVVLITRVAFGLVAYGAAWYLSPGTEGAPDQSLTSIWVHWDALRFVQIAGNGYDGPGLLPNSTAFFPLYPLSIKALALVGINEIAGAMVVSTIASLVAFAFLYKLALVDSGGEDDDQIGRRAVLYLAFFPTAVFLVAPYSESLFLAGAIPAFYLARTQRWHLVGIPTAVAMGARFAGAFLLIGLVCEFLRQRNFSFDRIANAGVSFLIGVLPLLAYGAFLSQTRGDPFYFVTDQRIGWGREFVGPVRSLTNTLSQWSNPDLATDFAVAYRVEVAAALVGLGFVLWALVRREWGYAAFMGATLFLLMTSTVYFSIPRILLTFFPGMVFLAEASTRRRWVHEALLVVMVPLAAVGVIVYTRGAWFF